jgi:hypothetical protein
VKDENSLDLWNGCAKILSLRRIQKVESGSHKNEISAKTERNLALWEKER